VITLITGTNLILNSINDERQANTPIYICVEPISKTDPVNTIYNNFYLHLCSLQQELTVNRRTVRFQQSGIFRYPSLIVTRWWRHCSCWSDLISVTPHGCCALETQPPPPGVDIAAFPVP